VRFLPRSTTLSTLSTEKIGAITENHASEFRFLSTDGLPIFCARWDCIGPSGGVVQGVLLLALGKTSRRPPGDNPIDPFKGALETCTGAHSYDKCEQCEH
jgi:hypothetical protein